MRLSAIVVTFCEEDRIASLVRSLTSEVDEVLVCDAGSPDATAERARAAGARLVTSAKGRGLQLDAGARAARGEALVFVHADTHIPEGFGEAIREALGDATVLGGNFRLRFVPETWEARLFSWANDVRRRLMNIYYGDSCIFVRRQTYDALGGFRQMPLFEDYAFVRRLEAAGMTRYVKKPTITSSARRFAGRPLRTLALWTMLQVAFSLGVSPTRLARFYADRR